MMAAILNSTMLDSDTAMLDSDTFLSSLRFTQKQSPSTLNQTNSIWLTWWWLPSWILPSWIQPFCTKLWVKLIQSDSNSFILTQLDDGSHLEFCHLEFWHLGFRHLVFFSQIHSKTLSLHLTLIQTNLIWLKLIHSHSTWWWQPSWILHLEFGHLGFSHLSFPLKLTHTCQDWFPPLHKKTFTHSFRLTWWWQPSWILPCWIKKTSLIHSDSTWWWQSSWILPCWIQTPCFLLSDILINTLTPLWLLTQTNLIWLKLIQSDSTWWWQPSWILPCWIKITSHIHSDSIWWWQPSWILPCWIQTLPCWIQTPSYLLSESLQNTLPPLWLKLIQSD